MGPRRFELRLHPPQGCVLLLRHQLLYAMRRIERSECPTRHLVQLYKGAYQARLRPRMMKLN